jgi:hypothetical protein
MARDIEPTRSGQPSIMKKAVAGLVLVAVGVLVFHFVVGLIVTVFYIVAIVAVIAAVLWAANALL